MSFLFSFLFLPLLYTVYIVVLPVVVKVVPVRQTAATSGACHHWLASEIRVLINTGNSGGVERATIITNTGCNHRYHGNGYVTPVHNNIKP